MLWVGALGLVLVALLIAVIWLLNHISAQLSAVNANLALIRVHGLGVDAEYPMGSHLSEMRDLARKAAEKDRAN